MSAAASFTVIDGWCEMPGDLRFVPILYNENAYIRLKDYHSLKTFLAINGNGQVLARIRLAKAHVDSNWLSLPGAPFGGIEAIDDFDVLGFLSFVKAHFKSDERLEIKTPPEMYGHSNAGFRDAGFTIAGQEINHHVDLTSDIALHGMQQRRLRKALKAGCVLKQCHLDSENAVLIHQFISMCREAQGLQININRNDFLQAIDVLPSVYQAYTVKLEDRIIAASVVVKVREGIVYNYLPASDKAYHHLSPMVLLISKLYEEMRAQKYAILDWGITSVNGEEQKSLARFKEGMGAVRSLKRVFISN